MAETETALDWASHTHEVRPWRQASPRGLAADKKLREVTVSFPPLIAKREYGMGRALAAMTTAALGDLSNFDLAFGRTLDGLNPLQLRTEAVDSSKIEDIEASLDNYGRALLGEGANAPARSMAAATAAMDRLITTAATEREITLESVLQAHRDLFRTDITHAKDAGQLRGYQNWVGGSDWSPRNALHVPPPPETVPDYMEDLFTFANRNDVPILAQAAIVHAQFESIHPFADGNGRIGRALIHAVVRRRRATRHMVVPIASALVAHRDAYFAALGDYRRGNAHTIVAMMASATSIATSEARRTADRLTEVRAVWGESVGGTRSGTPLHRVLDLLVEEPIVNVALVSHKIGLATEESLETIAILKKARVLHQARGTRKSPVWLAPAVLAEIDDLRVRVRDASVRLQTHA